MKVKFKFLAILIISFLISFRNGEKKCIDYEKVILQGKGELGGSSTMTVFYTPWGSSDLILSPDSYWYYEEVGKCLNQKTK